MKKKNGRVNSMASLPDDGYFANYFVQESQQPTSNPTGRTTQNSSRLPANLSVGGNLHQPASYRQTDQVSYETSPFREYGGRLQNNRKNSHQIKNLIKIVSQREQTSQFKKNKNEIKEKKNYIKYARWNK